MTTIAAGAIPPVADRLVSNRRPDVAGSGFSVPEASPSSSPQASGLTSGAASLSSVGAMLALQEQEQAGPDGGGMTNLADREARRHAQHVLEALTALQKALLSGGNLSQGLSRLAALAEMVPPTHDPVLGRILSSVRLRAQLELMRLAPRRDAQGLPPVPEDTPP